MTENVFSKTYSCTNGHKLVPNGHNDLNLMCGETKLLFVPIFTRFSIKGTCNICDKTVKYDDMD